MRADATTNPVPEDGRARPAWARPAVVVPLAGVVLALVVGAAAGGTSGALITVAFVLLAGAAWHLVTGRRFLGAPGRKLGVGLLVASLLGFGVGAAVASPAGETAAPAAGPTTTTPRPTSPAPSSATPTPAPTPTADDLADPDDPALNAGEAADLAAPAPAGSSDTGTVLAAAGRTALVALAQLAVNDGPSMAGYVRDAFGYRAYDTDRNGCDTRNDILRRDLTGVTLEDGTNGCVVLSGTLADPYSGTTIPFVRGTSTSNDVQIDHVVALGDAWASGAAAWSDDERHRLGNDPLNLLAVSGPLNTQKGDEAANEWLPPNTAYRCAYVARQVGVKLTYRMTVTTGERDAMAAVLSSCPDQPLPDGSALPTEVPPASAPTAASPAPAVAPPAPARVYYENCTAVWNAIGRPLLAGEPGYEAPRLDRDRDGVACESDPR